MGIADWKTIAPVMFPMARVSLPWRTQMSELNFSGSSVAMGAITSASRISLTPRADARCCTAPTNRQAPPTMQASANRTWTLTIRSRGTVGLVAAAPPVEPVEPERRQVARVDLGVGLEVALDVPGVDREQGHRDQRLDERQLRRQEGRPDREGVGNDEGADVVDEDDRVDRHPGAGGPAPAPVQHARAGHEHRERREHERRPQDRPDAHRLRAVALPTRRTGSR